jgi:hypothetical protein
LARQSEEYRTAKHANNAKGPSPPAARPSWVTPGAADTPAHLTLHPNQPYIAYTNVPKMAALNQIRPAKE